MRLIIPVVLCLLIAAIVVPANAVELSLQPDSIFADVNDTIDITCVISATDLMRSFTLYLTYDTNKVALAEAPVPGAVLENQAGLDFNYFDHAAFQPDVLEIGATIFGTDFWQGPGVLFTARFRVKDCGDEVIMSPEPPFLLDQNNAIVPSTFQGMVVLACDRVPAPIGNLVISPNPGGVLLRWGEATMDTLGRPLLAAPQYQVYRSEIGHATDILVTTTADTFYADPFTIQAKEEYHILVEVPAR